MEPLRQPDRHEGEAGTPRDGAPSPSVRPLLELLAGEVRRVRAEREEGQAPNGRGFGGVEMEGE